jgi:Ni/Co efflux regulator RcnB
MKTTLLSATALALILSVPAFAAPDDHGDHHGHDTPAAATPDAGGHGGGHPGGGGGHADRHPPAAAPIVAPTGGGMGGTQHHGHNNGGTTGGTPIIAPAGGGMMGGTQHHGRNNGGGNTGGAATQFNGGNGGNASRTHAGRGHNSAFDAIRRAFNAPRHYHHGTYRRPSGYYVHRWTLGEFLPALFFAQNYWIDDYSDFDLSDPPEGTHWVRYGNDALLIDEDSGEVIQVVYGIFY